MNAVPIIHIQTSTEFSFVCFPKELKLLHDLCESLAANRFATQNLFKGVMAHASVTFQLSNSSLENVLFDVLACNYLFRMLIFQRRKFNETQILTLLPSAVGFFPHVST
jgi:hypothetical protein